MTDDLPDPDRVAELARSVPGVADLTGGPLGSAATYLPGRRVDGVRVDEDLVAVHLVVTLDRPVHEVADDAREKLAAEFPGRRIDVVIEDVAEEDAEEADTEPPAGSDGSGLSGDRATAGHVREGVP